MRRASFLLTSRFFRGETEVVLVKSTLRNPYASSSVVSHTQTDGCGGRDAGGEIKKAGGAGFLLLRT